MMWTEFKPAFSFLAKFLGIYFVGNLMYGIYIESYGNQPDHLTRWVTHQTAVVLQWTGNDVHAAASNTTPKVYLKSSQDVVLSVFEGCNGLNVMIIFIAFVFAFGGSASAMKWFVPAGLLIIHVFNLLRILLLYFVSQHYYQYFYYIHKYLFTAILYLIVFLLWALWVFKLNEVRKSSSPA